MLFAEVVLLLAQSVCQDKAANPGDSAHFGEQLQLDVAELKRVDLAGVAWLHIGDQTLVRVDALPQAN